MNSSTVHFGVSESMACVPDSWPGSTRVHSSFCFPQAGTPLAPLFRHDLAGPLFSAVWAAEGGQHPWCCDIQNRNVYLSGRASFRVPRHVTSLASGWAWPWETMAGGWRAGGERTWHFFFIFFLFGVVSPATATTTTPAKRTLLHGASNHWVLVTLFLQPLRWSRSPTVASLGAFLVPFTLSTVSKKPLQWSLLSWTNCGFWPSSSTLVLPPWHLSVLASLRDGAVIFSIHCQGIQGSEEFSDFPKTTEYGLPGFRISVLPPRLC